MKGSTASLVYIISMTKAGYLLAFSYISGLKKMWPIKQSLPRHFLKITNSLATKLNAAQEGSTATVFAATSTQKEMLWNH